MAKQWAGGSSVGFLHLPYVQYTVYISQDTYAAVFLAIMAWCDGVEVEGFLVPTIEGPPRFR